MESGWRIQRTTQGLSARYTLVSEQTEPKLFKEYDTAHPLLVRGIKAETKPDVGTPAGPKVGVPHGHLYVLREVVPTTTPTNTEGAIFGAPWVHCR